MNRLNFNSQKAFLDQVESFSENFSPICQIICDYFVKNENLKHNCVVIHKYFSPVFTQVFNVGLCTMLLTAASYFQPYTYQVQKILPNSSRTFTKYRKSLLLTAVHFPGTENSS